MPKTSITFEHTIHYAHRIHNQQLPENVPTKCRNIHGHSGKIVASFEGILDDETGMIVDFYYIKKIFDYIDNLFDHKFLISERDYELINIIKYLPENSVTILQIPVVSCECLAKYLLKIINEYITKELIIKYNLPTFKCNKIQFWETEKAFAEVSV